MRLSRTTSNLTSQFLGETRNSKNTTQWKHHSGNKHHEKNTLISLKIDPLREFQGANRRIQIHERNCVVGHEVKRAACYGGGTEGLTLEPEAGRASGGTPSLECAAFIHASEEPSVACASKCRAGLQRWRGGGRKGETSSQETPFGPGRLHC